MNEDKNKLNKESKIEDSSNEKKKMQQMLLGQINQNRI